VSVHAKLAQARAIVKPIIKTETADAGKYEYSYASLSSVLRAVDEACNAVGLSWWQEAEHLDDLVWQLKTTLYDPDDDKCVKFSGAINTTKADPQANGSALTYARRYSLVLLFGMNQSDDDGQMAHRQATNPQHRTEAETLIRVGLEELTAEERTAFAEDFKAEFHSTLTALPESKHGDALTFWNQWLKGGLTSTEDQA
jgi:hypothetical protein